MLLIVISNKPHIKFIESKLYKAQTTKWNSRAQEFTTESQVWRSNRCKEEKEEEEEEEEEEKLKEEEEEEEDCSTAYLHKSLNKYYIKI